MFGLAQNLDTSVPKQRKCLHSFPCLNRCISRPSSTVESVLKDQPFDHKNMVSQDRWSLVTGSIAVKYMWDLLPWICSSSRQVVSYGSGLSRQVPPCYKKTNVLKVKHLYIHFLFTKCPPEKKVYICTAKCKNHSFSPAWDLPRQQLAWFQISWRHTVQWRGRFSVFRRNAWLCVSKSWGWNENPNLIFF